MVNRTCSARRTPHGMRPIRFVVRRLRDLVGRRVQNAPVLGGLRLRIQSPGINKFHARAARTPTCKTSPVPHPPRAHGHTGAWPLTAPNGAKSRTPPARQTKPTCARGPCAGAARARARARRPHRSHAVRSQAQTPRTPHACGRGRTRRDRDLARGARHLRNACAPCASFAPAELLRFGHPPGPILVMPTPIHRANIRFGRPRGWPPP